jgi:hypothetical protein
VTWLGNTFKLLWDSFRVAWPLWAATIITVAFVSWVYQLALETTVHGSFKATRWEHFLNGRPNELGDSLAGFVGSLTLIWVVASVIHQAMELKAQRQEFAAMVKAQDAQVSALNAQAEIFLAEQKDRLEMKIDKTLEEKFKTLQFLINSCNLGSLEWQICGFENAREWEEQGKRAFFSIHIPNGDFELFISYFLRGLLYGKNAATLSEATSGFSRMPVCPKASFEKIVERTQEIIALSSEASGEMRERISRMEFGELILIIEAISRQQRIWAEPSITEIPS